ncbi:MAG: hypothetical protein C0523_01235 [Cytophaga sp.]|nr:hypothetical protein [Cytophaga sp.]
MMPSLLTSCKKDDPGPEVPFEGKVAIIGAGAAGMYAADILKAKGIEVYILEASGEMGGRIRSLRNQTNYQEIYGQDKPFEFGVDFPIELGAELFYGSDSIWGKSVRNYNLPSQELAAVGVDRYVLDNMAKTAADFADDGDFSAVQNFVNTLPDYTGGAQTVQQAAGLSSRANKLLNAQAGNRYSSNSDTIGAQLLAEDLKASAHDNKWIMMKANPMQDFLLSRFSAITDLIQLNTPVSSINYSGDVISIMDKNGVEHEAQKVIVTVPLSILKTGGISFSPGLSGVNTSAMNQFGVASAIRVVIDFKKNFWGDNSGYIWGGTTAPQFLNSGVGRSAFSRTLSFTIYGTAAAALSGMTRDQQIAAILAELDQIYAGQATQFVRRDLTSNNIISAVKDWTKEEYIKGGNSYPLASATMADRENISKPIDDKIYFAGEATDVSGDAGTINGALASAERVTTEVIESILGITI